MQVKRLEGLVQSELLIRSNKGLKLTEVGDRLIEYARKIVSLNDQIVENILDRRTNGVVRLGAMEDYASAVIPPLIKQFLIKHPNVTIEVNTGLSYHMKNELGKKFDLVLTMENEGTSTGELLRKERPVWAKAPGLAYDPDNVPIALYPRDCILRDIMLDSLQSSGRKWRVAYHSHSIGVVQAAVKEGIALAAFKGSTLPEALVRVPSSDGFAEMGYVDINLHRATNVKRLSPAGLFADFLLERMAALRK